MKVHHSHPHAHLKTGVKSHICLVYIWQYIQEEMHYVLLCLVLVMLTVLRESTLYVYKIVYMVASLAWASCQIRKIAGAHAPGMPGTFSPFTAGKRSRHASRHVRHARAVMHVGIVNKPFLLKSAVGENVPGIPGACATCNFKYLVRGPLGQPYAGNVTLKNMGRIDRE